MIEGARKNKIQSADSSDDAYKSSDRRVKRGFPLCCLNWETDTWWGIATVISGMLI